MQSVDRRKFLSSGLITAGGLVAVTAFGQQKVSSPGLPTDPTAPHTPPKSVNTGNGTFDPSTCTTAGAVHASLIGSLYRGNSTKQDFLNASASLVAMRDSWRGAGFDQKIIPGVNAINEGDLTVAKMGTHINWAANTIRQFNSSVTLVQIHTAINAMLENTVVDGVDARTKVLQAMRSGGTSTMIENGIVYMNNLANKITAPKINATTHQYIAQIAQGNPERPPNGYGGGGRQPGCEIEDWTAYSLGIASTVMAVLTDGLSLFAETAVSAIGFWCGIGAGALATQQKIMC